MIEIQHAGEIASTARVVARCRIPRFSRRMAALSRLALHPACRALRHQQLRTAGWRLGAIALGCCFASLVQAGLVDVLKVDIAPAVTPGRFDMAVTLRHADTGWDHYANRWEVLAPDGRVLATRVLAHPHVGEQPFTRRLAGVLIPTEYTWIRVRGHDVLHGYGGREVTLGVPHGAP